LNSAQQDSVILRVVARYGFVTAVPATLQDSTGGSAPFAVLQGSGATTLRSSAPSKAAG
jgi:hypothetical protein